MRNTANYDAWKIRETDFPKDGNVDDQIRFIIRYGFLAPSTHNTQPWSITVKDNVLTILPNWDYRLPFADPNDRNIFISLGCFLANILIAANHFSLDTKYVVNTKTKRDTSIDVTFYKKTPKNHYAFLFPYIVQRFSNKMPYTDKKINTRTKEKINELSRLFNSTEIAIQTDKASMQKIANLYSNSVKMFSTNPKFAKELSSWLRTNNTTDCRGMPGFIIGISQAQSFIGKQLIGRFPKLLSKVTKRDVQLIQDAPAIGVIASKEDTIADWIASGMHYEFTCLIATSESVSMAPMTAIIEDTKNRKALQNVMGTSKPNIQLFFRLGYSTTQPYHTPRDCQKVV